jgi:D-3-phosphoglycerate dehydrogenase
MLSLVRKLGPAGASMKNGDWKRSKFMGTELYRKTLGVIGTGKIGTEVIKRAQAFGMTVLGYDPFLTTARAQQLDIEACEIDDICARADFISLHTPLTKDTRHLINAERLALMKPTTVVINCSRGGIIDEAALYQALKAGQLGGAGLDVFEVEPPQDTPLRELDNVILTPHLGASTEEAQVEVAIDVARQIDDVFAGRGPQSAVNLPSVPSEAREVLAPFLPLTEKLGRAQAQIAEGRIESVELKFCGGLSEYDTSSLTRVFLKGLLQPSFDTPVTYVNAPLLAQQRGVGITESKSARSEDYANLIETRVVRSDNGHERTREIDGTVFERAPHIVAIQGLRVDVVPEGTLLVIPNTDRPGMIGRVGTLLGDDGINIVGMQVGRKERGERAVMVLSLEEAVPPATIAKLDAMEDLFGARQIDMS